VTEDRFPLTRGRFYLPFPTRRDRREAHRVFRRRVRTEVSRSVAKANAWRAIPFCPMSVSANEFGGDG
jgi:hypothetical protein